MGLPVAGSLGFAHPVMSVDLGLISGIWQTVGPDYFPSAFGHWDIVHGLLGILICGIDPAAHRSNKDDGIVIKISPGGVAGQGYTVRT
jgi:hypothetical protein